MIDAIELRRRSAADHAAPDLEMIERPTTWHVTLRGNGAIDCTKAAVRSRF